jgi:hypothetical protein
MTAIVPDTLQGALIVSVIDFFLSFLIISGIGVILSFFPLLNRIADFLNKPAPALVVAPEKKAVADARVDREASDDIAAIAAAVFVAMEGAPHRIIHIEPSRRVGAWAVEGRFAQHSSHTPR